MRPADPPIDRSNIPISLPRAGGSVGGVTPEDVAGRVQIESDAREWSAPSFEKPTG
jgi:hypothetical protein